MTPINFLYGNNFSDSNVSVRISEPVSIGIVLLQDQWTYNPAIGIGAVPPFPQLGETFLCT
jgi:hypothetical protein